MRLFRAFSPCHITGFFQICDSADDFKHAGSVGAGVSLDKGVETTVRLNEAQSSSLRISINGVSTNSAKVSEQLAKQMLRKKPHEDYRVEIEHNVEVPIGAGFGTSGAGALSLALAMNEALGLNLARTEAAWEAHLAEVECKTGLGTVIAETFGGAEIRVKPGAPGIGEIRRITVSEETNVACTSFGPLPTKKFLTDSETQRRINRSADGLTEKLMAEPRTDNFMKLARHFAENIGLIGERVRKVLDVTDEAGFVCSMPIFGEGVFTLVENERLHDLERIFEKSGPDGHIVTSKIDFEGARLMDDAR